MDPNKIEEAETLPMNGTAAAATHKPVEVSMSNAMTYYTTNYRYSSMHRLDKYSSGSECIVYLRISEWDDKSQTMSAFVALSFWSWRDKKNFQNLKIILEFLTFLRTLKDSRMLA